MGPRFICLNHIWLLFAFNYFTLDTIAQWGQHLQPNNRFTFWIIFKYSTSHSDTFRWFTHILFFILFSAHSSLFQFEKYIHTFGSSLLLRLRQTPFGICLQIDDTIKNHFAFELDWVELNRSNFSLFGCLFQNETFFHFTHITYSTFIGCLWIIWKL